MKTPAKAIKRHKIKLQSEARIETKGLIRANQVETDYINRAMKNALTPPDDITIDDWVEKNIILPEHTCPEPGPLKISRTPYTRGILQAFGSLYIEHIVIVFGRQVGKSQGVLYPCLAYAIAQDPGPAHFVISTRELAKYTSQNRLQPMFLQCEEVKRRMTSNPDDFTNMEMRFQNMVLTLAGGGTVSQMISRPVRYLFRDEIDEITGDASSSADPLKAVQETTSTFANRKIVDTSTPTTTTGNIWQQLTTCQYVFEFWVPCPECGGYQIMIWDRIKFDSDEKDREKLIREVRFECKHCKAKLQEIKKAEMVINGQWRAREDPLADILNYKDTDIEKTVLLEDVLENYSVRKIGFLMPKWYGLFYHTTWANAVREFLEAMDAQRDFGDYLRLRDWCQYWAAKPWEEKREVKAVTDLLQNKIDIPAFIIPKGFVALTCGVDMAQDGFYYVILAWKRDMSCHLVHYGFVAGWESVTALLWETSYQMEGEERNLGIYRLGIDTGGTKYQGETVMTMTEACYEWIRRFGRGRAVGIKGASSQVKSGKRMQVSIIDKTPKGKPIPGGLMNWIVDTSAFKDAIHYRLSLEEGVPGRFTFSADTDTDYIKHLLSEEKRLNRRTGKFDWVALSKANHWLDATNYAFAVADPECNGGIMVIRQPIQQKATQTQSKHKSGWMNNWK